MLNEYSIDIDRLNSHLDAFSVLCVGGLKSRENNENNKWKNWLFRLKNDIFTSFSLKIGFFTHEIGF